jgi:hypothetical protein
MHITIGKRRFEDLLDDVNKIEDEPGVFVVVCPDTNGGYFVVDVGESDRVKPHLQNHECKDCWARVCTYRHQLPQFAVSYTRRIPEHCRRAIEHELRDQYEPPCGEA